MFSRLRILLKYTIQYACITHCTLEYLGDFVMCNGPSMEPTLYSNNILLTERISKLWRGYKPGDIIIAVSPLSANQHICKRVVAVSGEQVMSLDPRPIDIESAMEPGMTNIKAYRSLHLRSEFVPRGCVWIEGDNKDNSSDSRFYGPLPIGLIKSRVICCIWPLSKLKLL